MLARQQAHANAREAALLESSKERVRLHMKIQDRAANEDNTLIVACPS
jgi:hypothetical protein